VSIDSLILDKLPKVHQECPIKPTRARCSVFRPADQDAWRFSVLVDDDQDIYALGRAYWHHIRGYETLPVAMAICGVEIMKNSDSYMEFDPLSTARQLMTYLGLDHLKPKIYGVKAPEWIEWDD